MTHFKLIFKYAFLDLRKQKIRSILAIIGVLISIGLLTVVMFLSDSISYSYVNYLTIEAGGVDIKIKVRHYNGEPEDRSSYFEYDEIIDKIQNASNDIKNFIPRMEVSGNVKISEGFHTSNLTDEHTCLASNLIIYIRDFVYKGIHLIILVGREGFEPTTTTYLKITS